MSLLQSSSENTIPQDNTQPLPASRPPIILPVPEVVEAREKFNAGEIELIDFYRIHQKAIKQNAQKKLFVSEEMIQFPLSHFTIKNGILNFDLFRKKDDIQVDYSKVSKIKTFEEAENLFKKGRINVMEYRTAITDIGGGHPVETDDISLDKQLAFWNSSKDIRPGTDNNKSRTGFHKDCNTNPAGMYFQGIVKKTMISTINIAHRGWKLKYSKDAFVYDDQFLKELDIYIKGYIDNHTPDNVQYKKYDMELFGKVIDLFLGIQKEDIKFRVLFKDCVNTYLGETIFPLTPEEQEHFDLWCHK